MRGEEREGKGREEKLIKGKERGAQLVIYLPPCLK
jgi:hypothetical protein